MKPIETIKFNSPLDKEYKKQKEEVARQWCRHLKKLNEVSLIDHDSDTIETYYACSICGELLLPEDLQQRELDLLKFHNPLKYKKIK